MPSNESGSGATASGGIRVQTLLSSWTSSRQLHTGWGLGSWGGHSAKALYNNFHRGINASTTT